MKKNSGSRETPVGINYWQPGIYAIAAILLIIAVVFLSELAVNFSVKAADPVQNQQAGLATPVEATAILKKPAGAVFGDEALQARAEALDARENELVQRENASSVRAMISAGLNSELVAKMKEQGIAVDINEAKNSIRFSDIVLFSVNEATISDVHKEYLDRFLSAYFSVLMNENYRKYLDQVVIEGHADDEGDFLYNLKLSQDRAATIADFICGKNYLDMSAEPENQKLLTISGRSSNEPYMENNTANRKKSRRVEFIFRLKGDDVLEQVR